MPSNSVELTLRGSYWAASFSAMACPCEVLIGCENRKTAQRIASLVSDEVWRIEKKYNRFDAESALSRINANAGNETELDNETLALLNYAQQLFELSDGLFDISSGVLRKFWWFHNKGESPKLPKQADVHQALDKIGLHKINLTDNVLTLPKSMELDFGGVGKEYAADKALQQACERFEGLPILINLGGDIVATPNPNRWKVGIGETCNQGTASETLHVSEGAVTTSGTSQRRWTINGRVYSHILNPKTGWPIENPPLSVTVAAPTCIQAGMLSTLIMLQGEQAEYFADKERIECWISRP